MNSELAQKEMDFLGHILSWEGVKPDPKKLETIQNYKRLIIIKGIRSFLSIANFYWKFIKDFSQLTKPLLNLLKKKLSFEWKEEQLRAFKDLKNKLLFVLVLKISDFTKPFEVHINTSDFVISGVFMQNGHPIAFKSKKLYGAQLQWPIHKKELYVIVCYLKAW